MSIAFASSPTTDIICNEINLPDADLQIMLKAVDLLKELIDIIVNYYEDWYNLISNDIDCQYDTLKAAGPHYPHASKVKFAR